MTFLSLSVLHNNFSKSIFKKNKNMNIELDKKEKIITIAILMHAHGGYLIDKISIDNKDKEVIEEIINKLSNNKKNK